MLNSIKRISLIFFIISLALISCKNDKAEKEKEELQAYLTQNNITTEPTASGLYYIETLTGSGVQAKSGNIVTLHYEGRFIDGSVFDSSYDGSPFVFTIGTGQVIKGWDEGISYMKKGGKAQLIIPSELAYGASGIGSIPGYSTLVFDVELIDVK